MDREIVKEESMYDFYREQTLLLTDENKKLKKEIERLNNIINELEKESYLGMIENANNNDMSKGLHIAYKYMNNKVKELKGSDK